MAWRSLPSLKATLPSCIASLGSKPTQIFLRSIRPITTAGVSSHCSSPIQTKSPLAVFPSPSPLGGLSSSYSRAVVPLSRRRRKKWEPRKEGEMESLVCTTYCTSDIFDFENLYLELTSNPIEGTGAPSLLSDFVIFVPVTATQTESQREGSKTPGLFYFRDGCVVLWGTDRHLHSKVLEVIEPFEIRSVRDNIESEEMLYRFGHFTGMVGDKMVLNEDSSDEEHISNTLSFSYGLARSVKLGIIETRMDEVISTLKQVPYNLINERTLLSDDELLELRGYLNLHSDLIDTPDFYWDEPGLETIFEEITEKLDVQERINIINKKLDYAQQLVEILHNHLSEQHSLRLEWAIIGLIAIEVLFEVVHYVEKYMV